MEKVSPFKNGNSWYQLVRFQGGLSFLHPGSENVTPFPAKRCRSGFLVVSDEVESCQTQIPHLIFQGLISDLDFEMINILWNPFPVTGDNRD